MDIYVPARRPSADLMNEKVYFLLSIVQKTLWIQVIFAENFPCGMERKMVKYSEYLFVPDKAGHAML